MTVATKVEAPAGWGEDELSRFIDRARHHQFEMFERLTGSYGRLRDLDALWQVAASNLDNTLDLYAPLFFHRSHSAFRASCQLVLAGQLPETYMTLRGCLEFALYGTFISQKPELWEVWCNRNDSHTAKKATRDTFKVGAMMETLDPETRPIAQACYDRTIDYGAHPNQGSVFSSVQVVEAEGALAIDTDYITAGDTLAQELALRSTAQVGVCAFRMFGRIFKQRYDLLGLWEKLRPIQNGL
jgi:hypothetical protein